MSKFWMEATRVPSHLPVRMHGTIRRNYLLVKRKTGFSLLTLGSELLHLNSTNLF